MRCMNDYILHTERAEREGASWATPTSTSLYHSTYVEREREGERERENKPAPGSTRTTSRQAEVGPRRADMNCRTNPKNCNKK
jgi:hypothetical protein